MNLLTVTNDTQGNRTNDFNHGKEGEIAQFGMRCSNGKVDDNCGCSRSMSGLETLKASTTVKVTDVDITLTELTSRLAKHYVKNWKMTDTEAVEVAKDEAKELEDIGKSFALNSVIEIRGDKVAVR